MITLTTAQTTALALDVIYLCTCYRIARQDGVFIYLTDHDEAVIFAGQTWSPLDGFNSTAIQKEVGTKERNHDLNGAIASDLISTEDLQGGRYQNAEVTQHLIDWTNPGTNEIQVITVNGGPTGGTFNLLFGGVITDTIAFNASAATVATRLQATNFIGAGGVTVTGANGGPYTVTFIGPLSDSPQPLISAVFGNLTGGSTPTVTVARSVAGAGAFKTERYWIDSLSFSGEAWQTTCVGLTGWLQTQVGNYYTKSCRARLGREGCWAVLTAMIQTGTVSSVGAGNNFAFSATLSGSPTAQFFANGVLTWLTGLNAGLQSEVQTQTSGTFGLWLQTPFTIQVGDTFSVEPGCDHTVGPDGCLKFSNLPNYQAEPFLPGTAAILGVPQSSVKTGAGKF